MPQDKIIEEEKPASIGRSDYNNTSPMYGYEHHEKTDKFLDYYFSLGTIMRFVNNLKERGDRQCVLDLGSGIGRESDRFKKALPKAYITSLDISDIGTKQGKTQFDLNQVQADIAFPPFGPDEFDGIHCKDVLVHIKDKEAFIRNVSKMLKKGGLFLISSSDIAWEGFKQFKWQPEELIIMAEDAGMELVTQETVNMQEEDWYSYKSNKEIMLFRKK